MPAAVATTLAHEMGHVFGMWHDDQYRIGERLQCPCADTTGICILEYYM